MTNFQTTADLKFKKNINYIALNSDIMILNFTRFPKPQENSSPNLL